MKFALPLNLSVFDYPIAARFAVGGARQRASNTTCLERQSLALASAGFTTISAGAALSKAAIQVAKIFALSGIVISLPQFVHAQTTTIINTAVTGRQGPINPPLDGSDTLIITGAGSISTNSDLTPGVSAVFNSNVVTNAGSISTAGQISYGIIAVGSSNAITNSGLISTTGNQAAAIDVAGDSNLIANSGLILTSGSAGTVPVYVPASGIRLVGGLGVINNSGSISTAGRYGYGILAVGSSNTIANSGSISTTGRDGLGIYTTGGFDIITGDTIKGNLNSISRNLG